MRTVHEATWAAPPLATPIAELEQESVLMMQEFTTMADEVKVGC